MSIEGFLGMAVAIAKGLESLYNWWYPLEETVVDELKKEVEELKRVEESLREDIEHLEEKNKS